MLAVCQHLFVDADTNDPSLLVLADFISMLSLPCYLNANKPECFFDELSHAVDLLINVSGYTVILGGRTFVATT